MKTLNKLKLNELQFNEMTSRELKEIKGGDRQTLFLFLLLGW
ncbi:hypothetical protein FACS1894155_12230 [Bacteroidia bacterium]|nr:hypothetical protein FACS1894155_12230 [Bacteroidia bacterium]